MSDKKYRIVHDSSIIRKRIHELTDQINNDYKGKSLEIVFFINGGSVFCADLIRGLNIPVSIQSLGFNSYESLTPSGEVTITLDVQKPMFDKHILIVEGIIISGKTPKYLYEMLKLRKPKSIEICAVGVKINQVLSSLSVKYRLFDFSNEWIIGYGIGSGIEKTYPDLLDKKVFI